MARKKSVQKSTQKKAQKKAQKKDQPTKKRAAKGATFFGLPLTTWVSSTRIQPEVQVDAPSVGLVYVFGHRDEGILRSELAEALLPWQIEHLLKSEADAQTFAGVTGPVFVLRAPLAADRRHGEAHGGRLEKSSFARTRDQVGSLVMALSSWKLETLALSFVGTGAEDEKAALLGLEIGSYFFAENRENPRRPRRQLPSLVLRQTLLKTEDIVFAAELGLAINLARHLTNLPGGDLNPRTYSEALAKLFKSSKTLKVTTWEGKKLSDENMNLMRAVGAGAKEGPRLVHLRYRPPGSRGRPPLAVVGKGVTFDSGGLDIKPSSGMRWMKKDMGGSAAAAGVALWAERSGLRQPLDIYLALAENAIDANSFHPGDIVTARNGLSIEIHNTDAEGRLVLADALDVAVTAKGTDAPLAVIDLATLTGAIKIALGADIAGLFSDSDGLSDLIEESATATGELVWRMPLHQGYKGLLKSNFADFANASDGFAGAITAALFLQQFTGKIPWAHLDIYSWRDGAGGAWSESGGSGQGVQLLARLFDRFAGEDISLTGQDE